MVVSKTPQDKLRLAIRLLAEGRLSELFGRLTARVHGRFHESMTAYGLRRDLTVPFPAPAAKIPITVREAVDADADILFADDARLSEGERMELVWRRAHFAKRLPTCFVAIDERNSQPCYVQWLMTAANNADIQRLGPFPWLAADEGLLENAYTPPAHRGLGIMSSAMAQIAERGTKLGLRYVMTFVGDDNIASLKGCEKSGFQPHLERRITRWMYSLISRVRFQPLPADFVLAYKR